ncbi:nidogen-2-like isoform X1 [Oculina patagonica]
MRSILVAIVFTLVISGVHCTECERERHKAETMGWHFVPECEEDGSYSEVQCYEHGSLGEWCWCVNSDGEEILGTRVSEGQTPHCSSDKKKRHDEPVEPAKPKKEGRNIVERSAGTAKLTENKKIMDVDMI